MSNVIKIFENDEFGSLRTLTDEHGRIMFCGKDVASALGYSNTKDAIRRHCRWGVKHDLPHPQSPTKKIKMIFIPESDVYRLVAHSKLPGAEKFESWIFDEILPQINHTGGYVSNEDMFIENYLPFLEEPYRNLFRLQMTAIKKLNERIRHNQPLVDFANQVAGTENLIDMNAMAKLAADEHFKIGRTHLLKHLEGDIAWRHPEDGIAARARLKEKRELEKQAARERRAEPVSDNSTQAENVPEENNEPLENECDGIEELEMSM